MLTMAEQDGKLMRELKNIFPQAPEWFITNTIQRCNRSWDHCIRALQHAGYLPNPHAYHHIYPVEVPPPPYPGLGVYPPPRLSLQYENSGKRTKFTFAPHQDSPLQPHAETQQLRMSVSYNEVRRMGTPVGRTPENGVAATTKLVQHKTSVNFTPMPPPLPPSYDSAPPTHTADTPSSSPSVISSINVYIDPATHSKRPPMHITLGPARGGRYCAGELRPAPAPPSPATPTTPTAVRRRAPPRPPPPVVGVRRHSPSPNQPGTLFDHYDPEQDLVAHKPLQPSVSPVSDMGFPGSAGHDDAGYIRALILHQRERLEQFRREFLQEKARLESKRQEIYDLERAQYQRRRRSRNHSLTSLEELQKLQEENRRLRVDCDCMAREVDFLHKGQVPLGETSEEFYESIHTGQAGLVLPGPSTQIGSAVTNGPGAGSCTRECDEEANKWSCSRCTFCNDAALDLCEICGMLRFGRAMPVTAAGWG